VALGQQNFFLVNRAVDTLEKAKKKQQLANWFRFIMLRPFHEALGVKEAK
jgi:hypothetical protein